jgi:hypothetical protein
MLETLQLLSLFSSAAYYGSYSKKWDWLVTMCDKLFNGTIFFLDHGVLWYVCQLITFLTPQPIQLQLSDYVFRDSIYSTTTCSESLPLASCNFSLFFLQSYSSTLCVTKYQEDDNREKKLLRQNFFYKKCYMIDHFFSFYTFQKGLRSIYDLFFVFLSSSFFCFCS